MRNSTLLVAKKLVILAKLVLGSGEPIKLKLDIKIPNGILIIHEIFKNNGYKLYLVGGAVRDAVLNKTPKDFDLATDATPDIVEKMMNSAGIKTLPTGKAFGVINVFVNGDEYEVATFREDLGKGRRPDAVRFTDIETDVSRRDLTINALFYNLDTKEVVDFVGGIHDLKNGIIRTVGNPEDRFGEDRLRILRSIRFAGRFGSALDPDVDAALKKDASLVGISPERIREEFMKGITSAKSTKHFLDMVEKYGLFDWVFRGLSVNNDFIESKDPLVVIAVLLKDNSIDVLPRKLNLLKYTIDDVKIIAFLVSLDGLSPDTAVMLKRIANKTKVRSDQIETMGTALGLDSRLLTAFVKFKLTVKAEDVIRNLGVQEGPEVGKAIYQLETENFKKLY